MRQTGGHAVPVALLPERSGQVGAMRRAVTLLDAGGLTGQELRRRIIQLMLFRMGLITVVLALTVVLLLYSEELVTANAVALFAVVGATYALTLVYAVWLKRTANPLRLADWQIAGDLLITTALVHLTGGAQSAYVFFYPLSIIGATMMRFRRGTAVTATASVVLFVGVSVAGWYQWLPVPTGQKVLPWDLDAVALVRYVLLQSSAFLGVGVLAATLGQQLVSAGARLQAERSVSADLSLLNENIIRSLSSGLVTIDSDGVVIAFNQAAEEILGVRRGAAMGMRLADLVPEMGTILAALAPDASLKRGEIDTTRPEDRAQLSLGVSVVPLHDHRRKTVGRIVNFQDLTHLRHLEEQMLRSQRLAVVGQLAAGVAHEIRNPLASISGSIELLKDAPQVDEDNRALMDIVVREVDRLNGLISDLLDYARPRESVRGTLDMADLLDETVRVFAQDRTVPGVTVHLERGELVNGRVNADPAQIRQVLWNLLRNAAEAMPDGGEIHVRLRSSEGDGGRWTEVSIEDRGGGIQTDDLERIFDPFFTTKSRGTGLGLATVHRIVTEHGGTIVVDSTPGQGSTFTVRLPVAKVRASSPR